MGRNRTIILADGDPTFVESLAGDLRDAGYDVLVAVDGAHALREAVARRPDLMIADIDLPAGEGLSIQQRKDATAPLATVPVIYLTTDTSPQTRLLAETSGAALIHKPVESTRLCETISHVLANRAA